ncbi:MAG: 16S rRNA (cytidine(1402)-2'-O)-methyltransferase [Candidatus Zixiibacteriota bacterium]|nr:MAG: 16S rRNA (cytidine(1402)-2'-O)-methyltransferase [candidate division Zixibacteria bacterium]
MEPLKGKIYLVPTPIGNMGDITQRAIEVLESADLVACEDTRRSGSLLKKLGLKKKLISYHDFNEQRRARRLVEQILKGLSVAVITDGGSPGISDPAYRIVRRAIESNVEIVPLPGPTAVIPALTASGLGTDRFFFEGFLPNKSTARRKRLERLKDLEHTLVFYESPHRLSRTLKDMLEVMGNREICVAREISKKFEQFVRGTVTDILADLEVRAIKGEIVIVVSGNKV